MRKVLADNKTWIYVDELPDSARRSVANVIIGVLLPDRPGDKFLLTSEILENSYHDAIVKLLNHSMSMLRPAGIKENMLLLVSDAAP
ncbi:hypothetical protein ANN_02818 [Periplaneta americana]|uniref:DUF659 domain-containing protein n=1 Tax=Periplaneta americana TaxID=6978 RepID=A0ABQ8TZ08_PERAM|nr:hypothetical protein ANN_02818 [Periplaneta americana]